MTAAAAAEKKKKRDEMYYRFNTSRGMGYWKSRMKDYEEAVAFYTTAIENAESGMELPLIISRSKAQTKLVNHDAAREDALAVIKQYPDEIRGLENDAYTLYEKDDFEDSLVRNYRGLRKRKKPDYFYKGILVGKETIEDCIGRNAGPCMDQEMLGRVIVDMHMRTKHQSDKLDELKEAKRKYEKDRIDRHIAQKYLGRQAVDKQFLIDFLKLPALKSGNKKNNEQLETLISKMIENLNRQQETLMTQRPMYMFKHQEPKFSERYIKKKREDEKYWRHGVMKVIKQLVEDAKELQNEKKIQQCLDVCERLRRFSECQPPCLLSDNRKEEILQTVYYIIGTLFMDTKTYVSTWSEADNERRIEFILGSKISDARFIDKCLETYFPKIWNVKEMKTNLESRLTTSIHKMERQYLYHELCRCLMEEGSTEKAYKAAYASYKLAKDTRSVWAFNSGFLTALTVLMEGNVDDAKIGFTDVMIIARKLECDDCASFVQKILKIATEPNRLDFEGVNPIEKREKDIVLMMPTPELKSKAQTIMQKVTSAPTHLKMQLRPVTTFKNVGQGTSRRSIKINTRAKRRTLYEVKSSRSQNQSMWLQNNALDINLDGLPSSVVG